MEHVMSKRFLRPEHRVSVPALSTSARFYHLAEAAEAAAADACWSHFGWEEGDAGPPSQYVEFVAGRRKAAAILRCKAEGLRRSGY